NEAAKGTTSSKTNGGRQALATAVLDNTSKDSIAAAVLPSAPEPQEKPEAEPAPVRSAAQPFLPVRPVTRPVETPRQRKMWYGLVAASHDGAAFDAWTTRRAISSGF